MREESEAMKMICQLRPWCLEDAPELAAVLNDPLVLENLRDGLPCPYTVQDAEDYIKGILAEDPDQIVAFAITADEKVVGCISAFRQQNIHRYTAEVGYYLAREYWGYGRMTEALRLFCAYVFSTSDIVRLYAEVFDRNTASCRVLEKAGFRLEGVLRRGAVKNGQMLDMRLYARLRE